MEVDSVKAITVSAGHAYRPGDLITLADERPWWLKFWDWIAPWRTAPNRTYYILHVSATHLKIVEYLDGT
jgi:hypothetical protein